MANQLKKAGIEADVSQIEWSVYLEQTKSHKFDAMLGAWVGNTTEDEISQLWASSQAANKGSNHYSYKNPEADALMEAIKVEPDKQKRFAMSYKLQHIIVDDQPVTFMYSSPIRSGWVDRFDNLEFFHARPPFDPRYWLVRGAGTKLTPNAVPMSLHPVKNAQP
jgi:ABC-type transport system substrate-binding protein